MIAAVTRAAQYMGVGLANLANFYNPQRIIMGGGVVEAVGIYLDIAIKEAKLRALPIPGRKLDIVKAELGDFAGIIGAAILMSEKKG